MQIYQDKISDDRQDSFWYEGLIAENKGYELVANGEIKASFYNGDEYETHRGDNAVATAINIGMTDEDLRSVEWHMNNWFEIFYPDNESYVPDKQSYDEVIKEFKGISNQ